MMIDILCRWTHTVVFHSEAAATIANAVLDCQKRAREAGERAYLQRADLRRAYLRDADLRCMDLQDAALDGADLQRADLRGADLRGADLQRVDLQGADLRGAKGLLPNGVVPLQIGGSRRWIIVREAGHITIGCEHHSVEWWEEHNAEVGRNEGYTDAQIAEYRRHIAYCREWMEANGVLVTAEAEVA